VNPYREFQQLKPVAFIQDGAFVYDGTFDVRLAAALGRPLAAKPAYQQALAIAKTKEPSTKAIWVKTFQKKLAGRW
jgi:hypothetical protein